MRRRLLLGAALAAASLASPAAAQAAIPWGGCPDAGEGFAAFQCARVGVPLDHSGRTGGSLQLFTRRLVAPNPGTTAVVALAGGPGQAAAPIARNFAVSLAPALATRDLLVFDQRGTGESVRLTCSALDGRGTLRTLVRRCAEEIGPSRGLYRTADSVADLETLRREGGYERLTLYGVSYGTKVALAYAARHPDRVERLVLDSVVTPEGPDTLQRSSLRSTRRILAALCAGSLCRAATPSPVADLRRLLRRGTLRGRYVTTSGKRRRARMDAHSIFEILISGDANPAWRAQLPGAMRSAVRGDETPLLRLGSIALGTSGGAVARQAQVPASSSNRALYLSTICEELAFPWSREAGVDDRVAQATSTLNATPASQFSPFARVTAARALLPLCLGWPNAAPAPEPEPALPRVPSLVLTGMADVRTPAEDARDVAGRLGAATVAVPYVGHSVLGSDGTGCAQGALAAFFGDRAVPACQEGRPPLSPASRPPTRLGAMRAARGLPGRRGRTLGAVVLTRYDALLQSLGAALDGSGRRVGGLRGGTITRTSSGVRLRNVVYVPGVSISGTVPTRGTTRVRIRGRAAARGSLRISSSGRVRGRLGGRRVRLASARPASLQRVPTLEELDRLRDQRKIG